MGVDDSQDATLRAQMAPLSIAPAGVSDTTSGHTGAFGRISRPFMPYACQTCAKRKVKCDKAAPACSSCHKARLECLYQPPPPRSRKRQLNDEVFAKLARYERILARHGLLEDAQQPSSDGAAVDDQIFLHWNDHGPTRGGKLLLGGGTPRYVDGSIWRNLDDDVEAQQTSAEDEDAYEDDQPDFGSDTDLAHDPFTASLMGIRQSVSQYHPTHEQVMLLWETHATNVEPLCKVLHIPSTKAMFSKVSLYPSIASRPEECVLFAVYHFAVVSMTEEQCITQLGDHRTTLVRRYHHACRQALVNASFLKTTDLSVLQSLVLFLLSCRFSYDMHTYWILTGVAVRIGQRLGLHRDGEKLGLPPFEVQMRRRLFYQLLPLDGFASQMSGISTPVVPEMWDTKAPLNINDDQIWPGMTELPVEHNGATDMIFCSSRACVGKCFASMGKLSNGAVSRQHEGREEMERRVSDIESEVEERFMRYCDVVNPLHFLTMASTRCGITAMRLRMKLSKVRDKTATEADLKEAFHLAEKIIDTDVAVCAHSGLERYGWHIRPFFLWGTWDSLTYVLTTLCRRPDLLNPAESDATWNRLQQIYRDHDELLTSRRPLYAAFGRFALRAWDRRGAITTSSEPDFIQNLRKSRSDKSHNQTPSSETIMKDNFGVRADEPTPWKALNASDGGYESMRNDGMGDLSMDPQDLLFWDQLIQQNQMQTDDEQGAFWQ